MARKFGSCCGKLGFGSRRFGRRFSRRFSRRFGAFTGGQPNTLLQMEGPYGASSFGRRRRFRRFSRRFGKGLSLRKRLSKLFSFKSKRSKRSKRGKRRRYGKHSKRSKRRRRRRRGSKRFGKVVGQGYKAQTTYPNVAAPYFGKREPFLQASGWWYPVTGGKVQSPQMLMKW